METVQERSEGKDTGVKRILAREKEGCVHCAWKEQKHLKRGNGH
jgi:hypothetical protein